MKTLHTIYNNFAKRNLASLRLLLVMLLTLTITTNAWSAEGDKHTFTDVKFEKQLNNSATISDVTISDPGYPVKTIIVNCRYNKTAGGVTISIKIGGKTFASSKTHNNSNTVDIEFTDEAMQGDIVFSFVNNCGIGTSKGTFYFNSVTLVEGAPAAPCTVTLMDDNTTLPQSTAGDAITLPSRAGCTGYAFAGWTSTWTSEQTTWTTIAPTIIPAGSYTPTVNESLYPVYTKKEGGGSEPTAYSAGDVGSFIIASNVGNKWYAIPENPTLSSSKITGVEITVSQTDGGVKYVSTANAEGYTWTIADATNGQTISDGTKYIYHSNGGSSGTDLTYGTSTSYTWKIEKENNGLTFKGMNGSTTNSRGLLFNGSVFGGYALSNEDKSDYYRIQVLPIGGGSTTYYISVPDCAPKTYTIIWKNADDTVLETDENVPHGTTPTYDGETPVQAATAQYTYTFSDWSPTIYAADKDQIYTAQFNETTRQYTVTFNANGHGTAPDQQSIDYGTTATEPTAPTAFGYTFGGWYEEAECTNAWNFATDVVTGNITLYAQWTEKALTRYRTDCDACIPLDGYAEINGTYHFFPGETITLTVTPPDVDVPYTYQWQKFVGSDWTDIAGATTTTYTKDETTIADAGRYRCVVSSEGYCNAIAEYNVKCLQLYVYYDNKSDVFNTPLNRGAEENTATISVDLQNANYTYYFKITDGCGNWYGNTGTMVRDNCTNWSMDVNEYCGLQTTKFGTYVFNVNYTDLAHLTVSVIYPAALQEAGKEIYLDNDVLKWTNSNNAEGKNKIYYRIGRSDHNSKHAMTLVPGTANLYKVTTSKYDNFEVWHIANNGCWSENHSIFKTKTGDEWAATQATAFETLPVTLEAVTVTPTTLRSVGGDENNNNCKFYNYDITEGMKKHQATVIPATGGTITVSYTDHDGTAKSDFTSGDRDLAHTCLLTITATPDAGYKLTSLTVNDVPFTSGNVHTLSADAEIEVVWEKKIETSLSWSADSYTATIASESNKFPTLTVAPETIKESVTYSSSDETVATIDAAGNIRLLAAGTTIIRAYYEEDDTYAAAEDTYELIVKKSTNCRWEEVTIDDIEYGDEVVVAMAWGQSLYALPYNLETASNSNPEATPITQTDFADIIANEVIWYIMKGEGNIFTLSPKTATDKYLTCNSSDNAVRINTGENKNFTIDNDFLKNTKFGTYLAISTAAPKDWRHYSSTNTTIVNKAQTLKFYKKVCLPENEYWVKYNLTNVTCTTTPKVETITSTSEGFTLSFAAADGYILTDAIEVQMEGGALVTDWDDDNGILTINKPDGGFTGNITISIAACLSLPAPQNLAETDITSSSVTLTWDAVADAQSYEVLVLDKNNDEISKTTTECQITLTDLQVNSYYVWGVTPVADGFCGIQETSDFTTLQSYVVTFDNNGHSQAEFMPETQTIDHGTLVQEPDDDPTDNGYSFAGWYDNKECSGEAFNFLETPITGTTTLYAKWDVVTYIITYAGLEGAENNANNPTTYTIETPTITFLAPSTRDGYIFSGWSPATLETGNYGEKTITAIWEKGKIVTWEADGKVVTSQTYASGDALVLPTEEIEACQGSEFVGWTAEQNYSHATDAPAYITAGSIVNTDATYYAVYAEVEGESDQVVMQYTTSETKNMTGKNDASTFGLDAEWTVIATKGESNYYPGLNKDGTIRLYYNVGGSNYITVTSSTSKTITDIEITYKTSYNQGLVIVNGNTIAGEELSRDESIQVLRYSVNATEFIIKNGFTTGNDDQVRITQVLIQTGSTTYANYSTSCIPTYHVNYELAGGENGCADEGVKVGNDYTICGDEPTKTGYTFQHWTDGTNTYEAGATIENVQSNITLTAVWEANTYTITWMSNGEEQGTTNHIYDEELEVAPAPYNCYGAKTFVGWTEAETVKADGEGIEYITTSTNPSDHKTYYAVFADEVVGEPEEVEATLSFANKAQRTRFSSTQQVWEQNGITLTNTQGNADNDAQVADYVNPARFYANSSISIQAPGNITKIVFACSSDSYVTPTKNSVGNSAKSDGNNVIVALSPSSNTFDIAKVTAQIRLNSLTVTYQSTLETTYSNYTTTPSGCPEIEVAENAYVTSTSGQSVKVKVPVTIKNYQDGISLSASIEGESNFTVANISSITEGTATLEIAYKPTDYNTTENTTVTVLTKIGENKVTATDFTITGRSLPATFAIVAKVGNVWYALPSQGLSSTTPPTAYPVEVDDMADPIAVTAVPTNADWSLRGVYEASRSDATKDRYVANGDNLVFVNNASPAMTLNASSSEEENYLLTDAQYANYYETNPGLYEWTPTTTDLETYQLTNEQRGRTLSVNTATVFGVHAQNKAVEQVRFLPITGRYTSAALQVVEWKENSVVIMYNGDPAQTASVSVNGAAVQNTTLSAAQRDLAVYELAATGLAANPTQQLSITIGTEKTILSIPYIISGAQTDLALLPGSTVAARQEVAKVSDLVILKDATLTADGAKGNPYKFRNVTVYGGGKLVVPADNGFGVNSLTLRIGGVTADGNYDYVYPEFVLNTKDAYTNTSGKINLDYLTTKEQYYTFVAPFEVNTKHIKYPVDIYGSNVADDNRGSFEFQYYDGAERADGNTGWKVVEEDPTNGATLTAHKGYTFYGMPKKVTVNGETTRQKFGIHRIPMSVTASTAMSHENSEQTVAISAHPSEKNINSGWNLIGNPYMSTITGLDNQSIVTGTIVLVDNRWEWSNDETYNQRFIVFPSNDGEWYYTSQASNATLPAFKNFFVQIDNEANALSIPYTHRASGSAAPARRVAEDMDKDIELAIVLEQDDKYADQMDFLLNDAYSAVYDRNADFTKMMNNTNLNLFGVHLDDYLSFVAIDTYTARSSVAIGYQVPQAGQYTLRLSDKPYVMWSMVDAIYVTDHEVTPEVTTNLLDEAYTFQVTNAETNTTRFSISIVPSKESGGTTTAIDDILHQDMQTQKIIYNDQLYILRGGVVYDAMGQRVTSINK